MALRPLVLVVILIPASLVALSRSASPGSDSSATPVNGVPQAATYRELLDGVPVPKRTPFDVDDQQRNQYINSYREGFIWAGGMHVACPSNPNERNLHAIRGWINGWKAGAKRGGTSGLPAKYAPFIEWHDQ